LQAIATNHDSTFPKGEQTEGGESERYRNYNEELYRGALELCPSQGEQAPDEQPEKAQHTHADATMHYDLP
jgi:hypothetical protein